MRRGSIGLFIFKSVMAASSPESNALHAAASSPSSSMVDAVFSNLSPLKPEKAGPYWSRLTETENTLRSPQPVFASPHLALRQEPRFRDENLTVSSNVVHRHCDGQVKAIQAPNTTQLESQSANDATCSQSGVGDRGTEELECLVSSNQPEEEATSADWANERFDEFPEFTSKDVNYVESTTHLHPIAVEQHVGSYSIILNAIKYDLQNAEQKGFTSKPGDHNSDAMDTNQNQPMSRRHLQFENQTNAVADSTASLTNTHFLVSYAKPVTFRSHHYPSASEGGNSSMLHLNGIDRSSSTGSHLNVSGLMSKQVMPQRSHDLVKNPDSNSASLTVPEQFSAQENQAVVARESSRHALQDSNRYVGLNQASPRRKRKKGTMTSESEGCKRCNCKRSKCLKLYCECFAAGVYCVASCACTNCFNKLEYEDTVLDTRKQIESRNPLAFAPKVVKHAMDSPTNMVEDGNGTTPASARHKRGCNCKKSKCLKKYCECYQSKVGCSDGCRCDGCKNSFGEKTVYRRVERWRNESHGKHDTGQTSAPTREELDDTSNLNLTPIPHPASEAVLFSGSSQNQLLQGSMFQYPLTICTQQLYGSNILNDLTNEYTSYENIMKNTDPPQMISDASTPSKAVKLSSPNQKRSQEPGLSSLRSLRSGGKFILHGLPSFPPLSPCSTGENGSNDMESYGKGSANDQ